MCAVWIGHELEKLARLYELIDQYLRILVMNIVIARPMHVQQVTTQVAGKGDRRRLFVVVGVFLGQPLLVN